jgi:S-adenosylmethionine/arginine decarboxylase-like enzyme
VACRHATPAPAASAVAWNHPGFGQGRTLGGPKVCAACGGSLGLPWFLLRVVAQVYRSLRPPRHRHTLFGARAHSGPAHVPWGMFAAIDLHGCERSRLEDPDRLRRFVPNLIDAIGMQAHGPLALDRFGDGELEGWSAMQFIETSSITVHTDEVSARCFVDIFSCRPFDPNAAAATAVAHFGGRLTLTVLHR